MMFSRANCVVLTGLLLPLAVLSANAGETPTASPPPPSPPPSLQDLYDTGKDLFETFAPPEIKEQFEFPSKEQWDAFAVRLQDALDHDSLPDLAAYEPEARAALLALQTLPGYEDYADWLQERLDYIEAARQAAAPPALRPPEAPPTAVSIPYLALWRARLQARPTPAGAAPLMPVLRREFAAAGVPPVLAWMAETESTFNPNARSPAGARGLFQLMPDTAKASGLSTFLPDERTDPAKSARAAAQLLHQLHDRFGSWALALAAYNAGAGRVQRALDRAHATTFAQIAATLPSETRMYVPKVLATVERRAGVNPGQLDRPEA